MILSPWLVADALVAGAAAVVFAFFLMVAVQMVVRGFGAGYERVVRARWKTFEWIDEDEED